MSSYTCILKSLTANASDFWDFPCKMSLLQPNMTKKKIAAFLFPRAELCDGSLAEVNEKPLIFVVQSDNKQQRMMAEMLWSQQSHKQTDRKETLTCVCTVRGLKGWQVEKVTLWLVGHEVDVEW